MYTMHMLFTSILHHYLIWHYSYAFTQIAHVWSNLFWFTFHFFSIPQLLRSYIAPWKRMTEDRGNTFSFEDMAGFIIINLISRIIGMILRTIIIGAGLVAILVLCVGIIATYVFWVCAPALLIACMYYGFVLMFS